MIKKVYLQGDTRWGDKPYPRKPCTIGGSGCGEASMANLLISTPKYADETPSTIYPYMRQYAQIVDGECDGTSRAGIVTALKHYSFRNVVRVGENTSIDVAWRELEKGNRGAIFIVSGRGGTQRTLWTTGVHYICVRRMKKLANGDYKVWVADSSWRRNSGWVTYRKNLRGAVKEVIVAEFPKYVGNKVKFVPKTPYTGAVPTKNAGFGTTGKHVKAIQQFLNWRLNRKLAVDGVYGKATFQATLDYEETLGFKGYTGVFGATCIKSAKADIEKHKDDKPQSTPKPVVKETKAQKIARIAIELAWKYGTPAKDYNGKTGHPCPKYKKAFRKDYPNRSLNTGCDTYVNLTLKECGYSSPPMGKPWSTQVKWYKRHFKCIVPKKKNGKILANQFRIGDIVYWEKSDGSHHIYIIVGINGKLKRAEAVQHGTKDKSKDKWSHIGNGLNLDVHKVDYIFRAK